MIFPWLKGFLGWDKAPITWAILFTNIVIFMMTMQVEKPNQFFKTAEDLILTGRLYQQFQSFKNPQTIEVSNLSSDDLLILGSQGLRDPDFLNKAPFTDFQGDQVAILKWKSDLQKFHELLKKRLAYKFGLVSDRSSPLSWITYQFMHAGVFHLLSNMILFLLFAAVLESMVGGFYLIVIYLLCGMAGGWGFLFFSGHSVAPMIGASAAVSGVMACYAVLEKKKNIAYFYFLAPMENYFGWIYLPTYLIFPLSFLTDLASFLSTPAEFGSGIAHTAHIGGAVCGILIGVFLRLLRWEQILGAKYSQSHNEAP
jgi:membrane associated rhomboid family serine protease